MEALDRLSAVEGITAAISSRSVGGEGYLDEKEMAIPDSSLASSFGGRAIGRSESSGSAFTGLPILRSVSRG